MCCTAPSTLVVALTQSIEIQSINAHDLIGHVHRCATTSTTHSWVGSGVTRNQVFQNKWIARSQLHHPAYWFHAKGQVEGGHFSVTLPDAEIVISEVYCLWELEMA